MTAVPSGPVPPKGGPGPTSLKAPATSSTNPESVTSTGSKPSSSPGVTPPPPAPRRSTRPVSSGFLSDKATAAFIRRVLCAQHLADRGRNSPAPIQDLLPPLTSRNDVDLQLYALISIIIKEFVQNWYARITPDETFVAEIVQIIAHCTRALEQRLRKVDLESLLFDEIPELLDSHVRAYRTAQNSIARPPVEANPREIYHSLWPLPALSPVPTTGHSSIQVQANNESAYRQLLVQGVLALLLPTEDLENECLTALVGQLFSELVIGNLIINKLSEPWLIWEGLIMLTKLVHKRSTIEASGPGNIEPSINLKAGSDMVPSTTNKQSLYIQQAFWSVVQWGFVVVNTIRFIISTVMLARVLPPRSILTTTRQVHPTSHSDEKESYHPPATSDDRSQPVKVPIADFKIWSCVGNLLEMDARMPWMSGVLSMAQWGALKGPGNLAGFDGMIDRLLSHHIQAYILDPARLPPLLRAVRGAVFPNNAPGSPSLIPPSSDEQLAALRRRCASALLALVPKRVGRLYYGSSVWAWSAIWTSTRTGASSRSGPFKASSNNTAHNANRTGEEVVRVRLTDGGKSVRDSHATLTPESSKRQFGDTGVRPTEAGGDNRADMCDKDDDEDKEDSRILSEIETGMLDVFSDPYCNKHLAYGILELILVRLMPELAEKGVIELWEERLS
ncbi:PXA domain-containing protein [Hypoxylon sp. FL1857]|nr:PXA domain-containing protein [Hypoxylon sp. FL1857]